MLDAVVTGGGTLGVLWAVAVVHQLGQYVAGRQIVGIPGSEMRIVSPVVPRYVALKDGITWVSPVDFDSYRAAYERHDSEYEHFERFVTGGDILKTLVVVPAALLLALAGFATLSTAVLLGSILTTFAYVAVDAVATQRTGSLSGTYSSLWHISARIPILLLLAFLFVHLSALFFIIG